MSPDLIELLQRVQHGRATCMFAATQIEAEIDGLLALIHGAANRLETIRETDKTGLLLDDDIARLRAVLVPLPAEPVAGDLVTRLTEARGRFGLIVEGKAIRMRVPAEMDDDDLFISAALDDAIAALTESWTPPRPGEATRYWRHEKGHDVPTIRLHQGKWEYRDIGAVQWRSAPEMGRISEVHEDPAWIECHEDGKPTAAMAWRTEALSWKEKFLRLRDKEGGDIWLWQDDGENHPESLACPVLMRADQLRAILAQPPASAAREWDVWCYREGPLQMAHNATSDEQAESIGWRKIRVCEVHPVTPQVRNPSSPVCDECPYPHLCREHTLCGRFARKAFSVLAKAELGPQVRTVPEGLPPLPKPPAGHRWAYRGKGGRIEHACTYAYVEEGWREWIVGKWKRLNYGATELHYAEAVPTADTP